MTEIQYHNPVLLSQILGYFISLTRGTIVDATLGGGGHSEGFLMNINGVDVFGIDQDQEALHAATTRLSHFGPRFRWTKGNFRNLKEIAARELEGGKASGLLADLGVSSHQLTTGERGFSIMEDGPLDMRMDPSPEIPTAAELIDQCSQEELADILYHFGELHQSRRVSREMKRWRDEGRLNTTGDLKKLAESCLPRRGRIHPATTLFQALRIGVNQELDALDELLAALPEIIEPGGLAAIISFHSLEDRKVKHTFRQEAREGIWEILTPKPLIADEVEIASNPRSRSAKLRVVRRKA